VYDSVYEPLMMGSGSGTSYGSNAGGGAIKIETPSLTLDGRISASGSNTSTTRNVGSAGGSVWIDATTINGSGSGVIAADGGAGTNEPHGASSGGRIAIYYETDNWGVESEIGTGIHAYGGYVGSMVGGAGTIYIEETDVHTPQQGNLFVDNNTHSGYAAGLMEDSYVFNKVTLQDYGNLTVSGTGSVLTLSSESGIQGDNTAYLLPYGILQIPDTFTIAGVNVRIWGDLHSLVYGSDTSNMNLTISGSGKMDLYAGAWGSVAGLYEFDTLTIQTGGYMYMTGYDNGNTCNSPDDPGCYDDYGITLTANTININSGAYVTGDQKGYGPGKGPGPGQNQTAHNYGATHGGYGRGNNASDSRSVYDSVYEPVMFGSGTGVSYSTGYGGGAIKIQATTLTIDGKISVDGIEGPGGRQVGSAGGSIWIDAVTLNGSGTGILSADGGAGTSSEPHGASSGGRIAIYYETDNWGVESEIGTGIHAHGGVIGSYVGGPGTIYIEETDVHDSQAGNLFVDNNNYSGYAAAVLDGDYQFNKIMMTRYGDLTFEGAGTGCSDPQYMTQLDCETNGQTWDPGGLLEISSAEGFQGDSTMSDLTVLGTLNYTGVGAFNINGIDVNLRGDFSGQADFNLGTAGETIPGGLTLYAHTWARSGTYQFGDVVVGANGLMTLENYDNGNECNDINDPGCYDDYGVTLDIDTLNIHAGGRITADQKGYGPGKGPGPGQNQTGHNYGATHGGYGRGNNASDSRPVYDSVYEPVMFGSGTGVSYSTGYGGGAIKIEATTLTIDGEISVDGIEGPGGRQVGSAGGSIWIDATTLNGSGSGVLSADGGAGTSTEPHGASSGGRIAIYYETDNWGVDSEIGSGIHAYGGVVGSYIGGAGTVYIEEKDVHGQYQGDLYVDNRDNNGYSAGLLEGVYDFNKIQLTSRGHLLVDGDSGVLNLSSESGLLGDATIPKLTVEGTLIAPSTFNVSGVHLHLQGEKTGLFNLDIGAGGVPGGITIYEHTWAHQDPEDHYVFGDVTVRNASSMNIGYGSVGGSYGENSIIEFSSLSIEGTGSMYLPGHEVVNTCTSLDTSGCDDDFGVTLLADSISVGAGSRISSIGGGYGYTRGPGTRYEEQYAPSHGGYGHGQSGTNPTYGSIREPYALGSGSPYAYGGVPGGGSIKMKTGSLILDGTISVDGLEYSHSHGCGSTGGSIWIDTGTISGTGTGVLSADGKPGTSTDYYNPAQGSAGGGRIALYYTTDELGVESAILAGKFHAYGGGPGGTGSAGGVGGGAFGVSISGEQGSITIDGLIDVSGGNSTNDGTSSGGGGSGGSIYLKGCDIFINAPAVLDASGGDAPATVFQGGGGGGGIISLAHTCTDTIDIDPAATIDYSEGTGFQAGGEGVFTMYGAPAIIQTNQFRYRNYSIIAVGEIIDDRHVRIRAWVTDADAEDVLTMEVELKPAGKNVPWDNKGVIHSDPIEWTLGEPILMEVVYTDATLRVGQSYKWRLRIRDEDGAVSPWYDFGSNGDLADFIIADEWAPLTPVNLGQYQSDGSTVIPTGGTTDETEVILKATLDTAPIVGSLIPEFEIREIGVDFLDVATHVGELESWLVGDVIGAVSVTGLTDLTNYHWQMRACNGLGVCSGWVRYGGNAENEVDFGVVIPKDEEEDDEQEEEQEEEQQEDAENGEDTAPIDELPASGDDGEGSGDGEGGPIGEITKRFYRTFETVTIWWWLMFLIFLIGILSILKQYGFALVDIPYFLQRLRLSTLYTLGWKSEGDPWGIVYDSVTKELLSRCVVRLHNSSGELVDTSVTDVSGVFNFEPRSGSYQLEVSRSGYYFPSTIVTGTMDGLRKNVYHGEPYEVAGDKEPVRVYVPIDKEGGAGIKGLVVKLTSFLVGLFMVLSPFLLLLGMALSYAYWVQTGDWFNLLMLAGYLLMIGLLVHGWLREKGSWGQVVDMDLEPVPGVTVGLYDPTYDRLIDTRVSDEKGRFRFVVPGGEYIIKVEGTEYVLAEPGYEAGYVVGSDAEGDQQVTERVVVRKVRE
jgi:hypothetical protein